MSTEGQFELRVCATLIHSSIQWLKALSMMRKAILLFAQSSRQEAESKTFVACSNRANYLIALHLNGYAHKIAKKADVDLIRMGETTQRGHSFKERLWNACRDVFNLGYDSLVVIGNDTPLLTIKHLQAALSEIEKGSVVIGPSADGGLYFLGLQKKTFSEHSFFQLGWKGNVLADQMLQYLTNKNQPFVLLEKLHDVDDSISLFKQFQKNRNHSLLSLLVSIASSIIQFLTFESIPYLKVVISQCLSLRAPPAHFIV